MAISRFTLCKAFFFGPHPVFDRFNDDFRIVFNANKARSSSLKDPATSSSEVRGNSKFLERKGRRDVESRPAVLPTMTFLSSSELRSPSRVSSSSSSALADDVGGFDEDAGDVEGRVAGAHDRRQAGVVDLYGGADGGLLARDHREFVGDETLAGGVAQRRQHVRAEFQRFRRK